MICPVILNEVKNLKTKMQYNYYVYIITNYTNKVLYTGITNNIRTRVYQHKNRIRKGFTSKYNCTKPVYCESFFDVKQAIQREKQIKGWTREKKIKLIESVNPNWEEIDVT